MLKRLSLKRQDLTVSLTGGFAEKQPTNGKHLPDTTWTLDQHLFCHVAKGFFL